MGGAEIGLGGGIKRIRRIVTGHVDGRSTVIADEACSAVTALAGAENFGVTDIWSLAAVPASIDGPGETTSVPVRLAPPEGGAVLRIVQFPPDRDYVGRWDAKEGFGSLGRSGEEALSHDGPHEAMHRTRSVDFAIVMEGEIWSILDDDERSLSAGDVLIQRGTNHAWSNRSEAPALVAFVLVDAQPAATGA